MEKNLGGLSKKITFSFIKDERLQEFAEKVIRKLAHFSLYFTGGVLVFLFSSTFNTVALNKKVIYSLIFGVVYAASDELHQYFIPERNASVLDVCLDSFSFLVGITSILIIIKLIKGKSNKELQEKI